MKITLIKADITELEVDAIVNAANTSLLGGGGVDGAIHRKAGNQLFQECIMLNGCKTGQAKITKGYNLKARHIIHTVGPVFQDGSKNEDELLVSCYQQSLQLAEGNEFRTIAFPCISTGIYGFPGERAAKIVLKTLNEFSYQSIEEVIVCCYEDKDYLLYQQLIDFQMMIKAAKTIEKDKLKIVTISDLEQLVSSFKKA